MANRSRTLNIAENNEIGTGEWCLFGVDSQLLIGMVLGFCYIDGKTLKARQFTKPFAPVTNKVSVGVLCMWYSWDTNGNLTQQYSSHSFISIENYRKTIPKPTYVQKQLRIDRTILDKLNELI